MKKIIKEVCIGSLQNAIEIIENNKEKIDRIETCSSLDKNGLTPSLKTYQYIKSKNIKQVVMIRNRDSFYIINNDIEILKNQINDFILLGAKDFIFGYLTTNNEIDKDNCLILINYIKEKCQDATWSFHMAIDQCNDYEKSICELIKLGFKRILTKGGKGPAINNLDALKIMQNKFGSQIELIVGGKVTKNNWNTIYKKTNITQFHGTKII